VKFRVTKAKKGLVRRGKRSQKWQYEIVGSNGQTMMTSELLANRTDAHEAIAKIKAEAANAPIYEEV
jgi:uncharacterized protein YegP (UPF0339 family)